MYKKKVCKINENKTATTKDNGDASSSGSGEKIIKDRRKSYAGKKITVHDNRRICRHAVFKLNSRPWIDSDGVTVEEIVNTIRKCPSAHLVILLMVLDTKTKTKENQWLGFLKMDLLLLLEV